MVWTIPAQFLPTNPLLGRYPGSPRQRDKPDTFPASVQDTKGDYGQVWWTVQRGGDSVQLIFRLQFDFSGPDRDGCDSAG